MDINWEIFFKIHEGLPREGPGDNESTKRAFEKLQGLPEKPKILDVGCGPGMQTITLAMLSGGEIYALDNHLPFINRVMEKAESEGVADRVKGIHGSMFNLGFDESFFDVIWSEGAAYIYGVERALLDWKKFIKRGGYFVISDFAWLKDDIPEELTKFFDEDSGSLPYRGDYFRMVKENSYLLIDHFDLPESSWWEYYGPLQDNVKRLRKETTGDTEFNKQLDYVQLEIDMYKKYSKYYSYIFLIMKNV